MLGQFLRSLRKSKGLSQTKAGELCKLKKNSVIRIEKDSAPYGVERLRDYSNGLGFDIEIKFTNKLDKGDVRVYKFDK